MLVSPNEKCSTPPQLPSKNEPLPPPQIAINKTNATSSPSAGSSSSPFASLSALPPAYYTDDVPSLHSLNSIPSKGTNFLYIVEKRGPIRGAWTVDPSIQVPHGLLPQAKNKKKKLDNLNLYCHHKQIHAILTLASDPAKPTKSFLTAHSHHGPVSVEIASRMNQSFHLTAKSKKGDVTIYLPRDFEGPVTFKFRGSDFSPALLPKMTLFGRSDRYGTAFVGDWSKFGNGPRGKDGRYAHWTGDELVVSAKKGLVRICYADEPREEVKPQRSILKRLVGSS
ncbi:hypothetical protein FRB98_002481 [Tulasnella sp. 332]|nr:hypothetical protein FRB98_002481 [Tulasnella sp. 332]